ncbi:MAG: decarboxylating 6-phosphogluconate dehydrogenase [Nitrospirae bacterium]|nr:decarboxylating 6-phosphogluconate dehydrogenase [Nitrospirota bacterium]
MKLAFIGLGRMGMNMARRLIGGGHEVVAWNRSPEKVREIEGEGAIGAETLADAVSLLETPRVVWLMLPAGAATESHVGILSGLLSPGDIIVDGGNGFYKDDLRRAGFLSKSGIRYVDAGVSGGVWGLQNGYCIMAGGDRAAYDHILPALETLAPPGGLLYCGSAGAGHFMKMAHNGIEYGMMAAYAEGFNIIKASQYGEIDLSGVCDMWNNGSVIRSWLLELAADAFRDDPDLASTGGYVDDSGEGRWMLQQAVESGVPAPVTAAALFQRFRSRMDDAFADRVLAALRQRFGGHSIHSADDNAG